MYEDDWKSAGELHVETPEQVALRLPIAGVGSRLLAILTDSLLQLAALVLLGLVILLAITATPGLHHSSGRLSATSESAGKWAIALIILLQFLLLWGYFTLFEGLWNGQTPGKRLLKIRVLADSGRPITFFEAMARNLLRIIDLLPTLYLVGLVTMLCNRQSKRLGDLLAGTLVVHETETVAKPAWVETSRRFEPSADTLTVPADALVRLQTQDRQVLEAFFARNIDLPPDVRSNMAIRIATALTAKMRWGQSHVSDRPERLLDAVLNALRDQ